MSTNLTRVLEQARQGDHQAADQLAAALYEELRRLAQRELAGERRGHTLQPTALVHEAYLRLVQDDGSASFEGRAHFFGAAATAIRRVLVDHARHRSRLKRGGERVRVELEELGPEAEMPPVPDESWIALDDALHALARCSPKLARLVELRFFGGLTIAEVARDTGVSESTVERDWRAARAWLRGELSGGGKGGDLGA